MKTVLRSSAVHPSVARRSLVLRSAAALVLAACAAGPAAAITTGSLNGDVQSALSGSGNVNVSVRNGVATLTGYADTLSRLAVERVARADPRVKRVVNLVLQSS